MINSVSNSPSPRTVDRTAVAKAVQSNFRSAMTSAASQADSCQDTLQITGMSDSQKLAELKRLHEQTDYSGMTNVEKYRTINDRFEACFPVMAMMGGLFGPHVYSHAINDILYKDTIQERVLTEIDKEAVDAGIIPKANLRREAYYDGMSDQEVIAAVKEKYNSGTFVDRANIVWELENLGLFKGDASVVIKSMRKHLIGQVGGITDEFGMMDPFHEDRLQNLAFNTKVSWGQIAGMIQDCFPDDGDTVDWLLKNLVDRTQ